MISSFFSGIQKVGQAFMLPVAVLPVAGILLGVGASNLSFIPESISQVMSAAGDSIFGILPLLFALATAIAFAKNDGVAGLAALVGYVVYTATIGVVGKLIGSDISKVLGIDTVNTGVLGGILVGFIAAYSYTRYNDVKLPDYLAFFGGRRFVPIVTALIALLVAVAMAFIWSPIGSGIKIFSNWAAYQSPTTAFTIYAFIERLLIPTGLHHIWNVPFFFEVGSYVNPATQSVVTGEIPRYLAGDPTAGNLAGSYLFKMYGLPAAAIAMIHTARPENKKMVASIMISAAITSFLTGITEPIEFSFLFVAPILYGFHALLAAIGYLVVSQFDIKHGTTFSHGLIDYVVLFSKSTNAWKLIPLGLATAVVYYIVFRFAIQFFDLKTPGRTDMGLASVTNTSTNTSKSSGNTNSVGADLVSAYGGADNITNLNSCITRLRITVKDPTKVSEFELKKLGAVGFIKQGQEYHSVFGPKSDSLRLSMEKSIEQK